MLYVTNGAVVIAFDVQADGALANQREFGKLRGGQAGDGSAVDAEGRLYVATGSSADVVAAERRVPRKYPRAARSARHVLRGRGQEDALRHRLLRHVGDSEREESGHRYSNDRAGVYGAREVVTVFVR